MKIREVISENPIGSGVGAATRGVGTAIGAVAGAPKAIVKGVKTGAAAWDKLMSPSQWFSGKGDKADADDTIDKDKTDTTAKYVDSLNAVAQGLVPNAKDVEHLKLLASPDKLATPEEQAVLKAAYSGQKLNPEQIAIIKQLTYKL